MFNLNSIVISGFLGQDPDSRTGQSGTMVTKLRLGVSQRFSQGKEAETMWLTVKCFGKQAEYAVNNLKKGDAIGVTGKLTYETWVKQDQTKTGAFVLNADLVQKDRPHGQSEPTQQHPQAAAPAPAAPRRQAPQSNGAPRVPVAPKAPPPPPAELDLTDDVPF